MFHICWRFDAFLFYEKQSHKAYSITLIKSNFFPSPDWNRSSYSINGGGKNAFDILHHISMGITFKTQTNNFLGSLHCEKKTWEAIASIARRTVVRNVNNPPKIRFKKIIKLMDHICSCNGLTFESKAHAMTGNNLNFLKLARRNVWNHITGICFRLVLVIWNQCASLPFSLNIF